MLVKVIEDEPADRGALPIGAPVSRKVTVQNVSGERVIVQIAGTTCPCTTARLEREILDIDETTSLVLFTTAADVNGQVTYAAMVTAARASAAPTAPKQSFSVPFSYMPDVQAVVSPRRVAMYTVGHEPTTYELVVRRLDAKPAVIDRVTCPGDWIHVKSIEPSKTVAWQSIITLESGPVAPGFYRGKLEVVIAGDTEGKNRLDVSLRVDSVIRAEPAGVIWREKEQDWGDRSVSVTLQQRRPSTEETANPSAPHSLRLSPTSSAITTGPMSRSATAPDSWRFQVSLDPKLLGDDLSHGSRTIDVLDADGNILCTIPVIWFSQASLQAP